ncbi:MAG TPA: hypothetical protein PK680_11955, partial [Novosphingobium sp.]|nr:hypothetical protein [Novosphingobium sp.]
MIFRRNLARLACAAALAAPVLAAASPLVAFDSAVFVERVTPDRGRMLQPAATLKRGDRVVYVVSW